MTTESENEDTSSSAPAAVAVAVAVVAANKTDYYDGVSGFGVPDWFHGMFCNGPWMSDRNFDLIMPKDFDSYHPYV
jgi:hypothetical protein